jgi:hypothetical protein
MIVVFKTGRSPYRRSSERHPPAAPCRGRPNVAFDNSS